ncbi:MAG: 6'''-hydroxyparomomycin C oxidase [Gammaproteobacteria bacterium]|nr:6'''-hydroxyparomomycin C oxidase [Gammaproteobacteria bacterium]
MTDFDDIIVGSGAGGSAAAYVLARAGRRVALVEKGRALPTDGSTLDMERVIRRGEFRSAETWLDRDDRHFEPEEYFNLGGKTKWYGAALLRHDRSEFEGEAAFQCLPWPIGYEDLAPYYEEVERLLGVRAFAAEPDIAEVSRRMNGSAWRPAPLPLGLAPQILEDRHEATHFDGFASARGLKADAQTALLDRIPAQARLTVITGQPAEHLIADRSSPRRVRGAQCADGRRISAERVLLAAGALHSPRLLQRYLRGTDLAYRLPCAPWVGRYFKRHLLTAVLAFSPSRKTDAIRKTVFWLSERFPHSSVQPLGFGSDVIASLLPSGLPRRAARPLAEHAYGFFLQTEDGSHPDNRVIAEGAGARLPRLDYDPRRTPEALREHAHVVASFRRALLKAGLLGVGRRIGLAGTAHACGTLVAGRDPRRSVVDANGRVHGMENLYVVDGSVLPRSSRVNPSLTIYAWAMRVADRLSEHRRLS